MSIDQRRLERLINIAGMLGSEHDGERANAARIATSELRQLGFTWRNIFDRAFARIGGPMGSRPGPSFWETDVQRAARSHAYPNAYQQPPRPQGKQRTAKFLDERTGEMVILWDVIARAAEIAREDDQREILTEWERAFISSFTGFGPRCMATPSQWAYVIRIRDKLRRFGVAV